MTRPVTKLRHVDLAVPDFAQALEFYEKVWGLTRVADDTDVAFLATENSSEPYSVRLRKGDKRLDLIAFGAPDAAAVDALAERLGPQRIIAQEPGVLDTPGGGYGVGFFDPDGRLLEVSADVTPKKARQLEERESIPARLSHVVINSTDVPRLQAFYEDVLGFKLSDQIGDFMKFLRCNTAHHSIAITQGPHVSVNHVSFEMHGLDEYMRGTGRMIRAGYDPIWGPGRHTAGDNTFSYFRDPHGNVVEYTTELQHVPDDGSWIPGDYTLSGSDADQWGTAGEITEAMIINSVNEEDHGCWKIPPL